MSYYVGVDVGGTFTDVVFFDSTTAEVKVIKVPTTTESPELAVIYSIERLVVERAKIAMINHATTIATNALLTRSNLPRVALITNKGFRDIIEIGRQRRPELYDLRARRPEPLVPRKYRIGIRGRILYDGTVKEDISRKEILGIKRFLMKERIESVAISLLNSYANPIHEKRVKELLDGYGGFLFASHEVMPEYREFERTSTTVVNAVLAPIVSSYLSRLEQKIRKEGISSRVYVMSSNGGLNTLNYASRMPVSLIESGPSAGVLASVYLARHLGLDKVITFDMGGTTAKASAVIDFRPDIVNEFEVAGRTHSGRSIKGSGYAVRFPFIDVAEVSAGGGTIAWLDEANELKVGPMSAGANPGPACYGKGGSEPTVTDANLVLGRLNQEYLLGGEMKIYKELALKAMQKLSSKLGIDHLTASKGILRIVNNSMARAISIVSIERGRDTREFKMICFGGAGPLHACDLAEEMNVNEVIIPVHPGLFSAYGLLSVDLRRSISAPVFERKVTDVLTGLKQRIKEELKGEGFNNLILEEYVNVRYKGQSYEITISFVDEAKIREEFEAEHKKIYGYTSTDPIEIVSATVVAIAEIPKIELRKAKQESLAKEMSTRLAYVSGNMQEVNVVRRETLPAGEKGKGPAIIEEYDSTTVVNSGWNWEIDDYLNIVMRRY